jgi:cell division protein FtsB
MQAYPVKPSSSSRSNALKPDYEHADDFDFHQKNGVSDTDATRAQKAAELLEKEVDGTITAEQLKQQLDDLLKANDAQKQLIEKMSDELLKEFREGSADEAQEKLSSLVNSALNAVQSGDYSHLDPNLLLLLQSKTQDQNSPLMSHLDQENTDPNANFLASGNSFTSNELGSSFSTSPSDSISSHSVFSTNALGRAGPLNLNSTDILMVVMLLLMSVASGFEDQMKLQAKLATDNKKSIDQINEASQALQELKDAINNADPKLDDKNPSVDLVTLLKNQGGSMTHLTAWLENQGGLDPKDLNNPAALAAALQKARDNTNNVSTDLGNTGKLIPTSLFSGDSNTATTFTFNTLQPLTTAVKAGSDQMTNNSSVSQPLLTSLQATTQQRAQVMTMAMSILDVFKQIGQKLTQ